MGQGASPGQSGIPGCLPASAGEPGGQAGLELLGQAGMVAVRVADLASPAREGLGKDGRTALVTAGAGKIGTGDLVVFCKPVVVAAAVVRRDGRVQAAGHPADQVRLGVAEERLDALCGEPGVIDRVAAGVTLKGRVKGAARRAMTAAMVIRLVLLMTLMPGSSYAEAIAAMLGDLPLVPWHHRYQVPTPAVACTWRDAVGPAPLEELQDKALAIHRVNPGDRFLGKSGWRTRSCHFRTGVRSRVLAGYLRARPARSGVPVWRRLGLRARAE